MSRSAQGVSGNRVRLPIWDVAPALEEVRRGAVLSRNHAGPAVRTIQEALNLAGDGRTVVADGSFGEETEKRVLEFQRWCRARGMKIGVDGIIGKDTLAALEQVLAARAAPPPAAPYTPAPPAPAGNPTPLLAPPARTVPPPAAEVLPISASVGRRGVNRPADVELVQEALVRHEHLGEEHFTPGVMDRATQRAIDELQRRRLSHSRDGRVNVGGATARVLAADHSVRATDSGRAAGAQLEAFPVTGSQVNVGWDPAMRHGIDYAHPHHNSDYSKLATNARHSRGHLGIDVFAPRGTGIVAPVSGVVTDVDRGTSGTGGRTVTIQRGNYYFYLAHLDTVASGLRVGDAISAGTPIGTLGNTGSARGTAPHLHFSIYVGGNYRSSLNPFPYLMRAKSG